jgi:Uma2 family endonuclease
MAALPEPRLVSVEEHLNSSYPEVDREYVDGVLVERSKPAPWHSALQHILERHLIAHEKGLQVAVRPNCRTRINETRYRAPGILVLLRPFRQTKRVLLDPPLLIVEILSPDDSHTSVMRRFLDYEASGVPHIGQMDPEERTTCVFQEGSLIRRNLTGFDIPDRGFLPFDSRDLLAQLDQE